jgi:hypothetical protein
MILDLNTAGDFIYYLCVPLFLLFIPVGIIYAMILLFRRVTGV